MSTFEPLTRDELTALESFAERHGRQWKAQLRRRWEAASASPTLHRLRNTHGPAWLKSFKLSGAKPQPVLSVRMAKRDFGLERRLWDGEPPRSLDALPMDEYSEEVARALRAKKLKRPKDTEPAPDRDDWERKAIIYARWLAARDGIKLAENSACIYERSNSPKPFAVWDTIPVRRQGKIVQEKRIRAVEWRHRLAGGGTETALRIDLPHWDWVPEVEHAQAA